MHVATPPEITPSLAAEALQAWVRVQVEPLHGYPHWDKVRHLDPPDGLTHEAWWIAMRMQRSTRPLPLTGTDGQPFSYGLPDEALRLLHLVDQECAGKVAMDEVVTGDAQARKHYLVSSLMEEAIRSSQLEGAATTRQVAKEMLRSGREPRNHGELMIVNNYRALGYIRDEAGDELTPAVVLELQRILTEGTLHDVGAAGRLRRDEDDVVVVVDVTTNEVLHEPPPAQELPARLQALCDFANDPIDGERFIHPVVRGILLHFWLAYDHPFVDGNGRTARALFYWYMRTHGYWLVEYLTISQILREAPAQYKRAFLHTETDGGDTTYFLLHQLQVIARAVHEFQRYLRRKMREVRDIETQLEGDVRLNRRQLALLGHALRHPEHVYTLGGHARDHRVTHETARSDFAALVERGLLIRARWGRSYRFTAPHDLAGRLQSGSPAA